METFVWIFGESKLALGVLLALVNFFLLVYWRSQGRPKPLLIGLGVSVVLFIIQAAVVTQCDHAGRVLEGVERDVVEAKTDRLAAALAPDFETYGMNREQFVKFVGGREDQVDVNNLRRIGWFDLVESESDRFVIEASYYAEIRSEMYASSMTSRWRIEFVQTPNGWKIRKVDPISPSFVTWESIRAAR